mmetsp:Transcript_62185/g.92221  ORF Transcript_62185/g.92221 Transcript_62185/m.92221 type:complete len:150 (+) Transcript_62185:92-541(+)
MRKAASTLLTQQLRQQQRNALLTQILRNKSSSAAAISRFGNEGHSSSSSRSRMTNQYLAAAGAATLLSAGFIDQTTDCCGIAGVVGIKGNNDAREFLLEGLTVLKNRGYDSAGLATMPEKGGKMVRFFSFRMDHFFSFLHATFCVFLGG